jgi:hypothetical protein
MGIHKYIIGIPVVWSGAGADVRLEVPSVALPFNNLCLGGPRCQKKTNGKSYKLEEAGFIGFHAGYQISVKKLEQPATALVKRNWSVVMLLARILFGNSFYSGILLLFTGNPANRSCRQCYQKSGGHLATIQ